MATFCTLPALAQQVEESAAHTMSADVAGRPHLRGHTLMMNLSASVQKEVDADTVRLVFSKQVVGDNQQQLTQELNKAINAVIDKGKKVSELQISNGDYGFWQTSEKDKNIRWEMRGEVIVISKDFQKAQDFIATVKDDMTLDGIQFFLSDENRKKVEDSLITQAAADFKFKAETAMKSFGFTNYHVVNINLGNSPIRVPHMPGIGLMSKAAAYDGNSVELSSTKIPVSLSIEGTVQGYNEEK
ncbi:SIMPL domain-containing protein [Pelistega europaea]|uniref:SIMPL domain-containing protein n=1 Tax=Pelistega europaea TaxID=106147 RepID=A0A7Y4LBI8_9BURK|nr:SIMPL domain-containing protein [Pelistega europaea]NOL50493.1 SIMPL domain-containing protein [Pelistega europaea]